MLQGFGNPAVHCRLGRVRNFMLVIRCGTIESLFFSPNYHSKVRWFYSLLVNGFFYKKKNDSLMMKKEEKLVRLES